MIGSENANHVFDVRLKEPYDENLKRLNEFADKTFPNVALHFSSVDGMIKDITRVYIVSVIQSGSLQALFC